MSEAMIPSAAVEVCRELYSMQQIADKCGVRVRQVYSWQSGAHDAPSRRYKTLGLIKLRQLYRACIAAQAPLQGVTEGAGDGA